MRWQWTESEPDYNEMQGESYAQPTLTALRHVRITPQGVWIDGHALPVDGTNSALLTAIYKQWANDYPKFYKMDGLSRLAFVAGELLTKATAGQPSMALADSTAIVFVGNSGSLASDIKYQDTIRQADNFFPSPAHFVYTLPNIATGELAIRHNVYGETAFFIASQPDEAQIHTLLQTAVMDGEATHVLGGWLEYEADDHFEAQIALYVVGREE